MRKFDELVRPGDFVASPSGQRWVVGFVIAAGVYPVLDEGQRPGRHWMLFHETKTTKGVEILYTVQPEAAYAKPLASDPRYAVETPAAIVGMPLPLLVLENRNL